VHYQNHGVTQRDHCISIEQKEHFLCVEANTVVDPGAVVVDHDDTAFALRTVMNKGWYHGLATVAELFNYFVNCGVPRDVYIVLILSY